MPARPRPGSPTPATLGWLCWLVALLAGAAATAAPPGSPPGHALFTDGRLRTFRIEVTGPALEALRKSERSYTRATVREGDRVYVDVGVHLKGMGSFQPLDQKPSFAVKFDKYTPDQEYDGLSKFMLNNSVQDPTYLAESLSTSLFRDAGVPAARVTHARVEFNGRPLGLYVLIEAMNKDFLRQHFRSADGNLYEAYLQDIDQRLDQDSGDDTSQQDLKRLLEVCRLPGTEERWRRLPEVLDVDRYVAHCAVEMFIAHTDGYAMNRNNYRLYCEPGAGRFAMIAHGADWGFANTGAPIRPPTGSLITRAVIGTPQGRQLYNERVRPLFTNVFRLDLLSNRVATAVARLKSGARDEAEARTFAGYGTEMQRRFAARHETVARLLALPDPKPLPFDARGVATLGGWQTDRKGGQSTLDIAPVEGRLALSIKAGAGGCTASWRTTVILPAGKFRFTGDVRTTGVTSAKDDPTEGAALRISGGKRLQTSVGDTAWTRASYDLEVTTEGEERTLVCELRAQAGQAWFALDSLRLERLP
ncbi:MAG: hypothetical protein RJA22_503 [Verrucomicrobiota bacterium]